MISLISGGCQVRKSLFHILRHGLTGEIDLSEPIPCKLIALFCGLVQPFQSFYCALLREEQLPEGVFREIITGFCRAPKPLLCFFVVTQGGEIIPIELTKLMCRNGKQVSRLRSLSEQTVFTPVGAKQCIRLRCLRHLSEQCVFTPGRAGAQKHSLGRALKPRKKKL